MIPLPDAFLTAPLAHRGFHDVADGRPENSRAAFEAAIKAGYGIELDVQLSADDQAMVFHDYRLTRLTGASGVVRQFDQSALQATPLTGGDETIPSLPEALELVDGRTPLLIEIKDQDGQMGLSVGALEVATAKALKGYSGAVAVMSFNPNAVAAFSALAPDLPVGLVTSAYHREDWAYLSDQTRAHLATIPDYDRLGASFISHEVEDLASPRVAEVKKKGGTILCWTVRSPEVETKARKHAQNITFEGYDAVIPG